jgi:hypothetical protein
MHGLHHLQYSRGLRAKLGLPATESVDLSLPADPSDVLVLQIPPKRWLRIVDAHSRADILESFV